MSNRQLHDLLRYLRRTVRPPGGSLSDADLVERFADRRDEAAFEALVWRHAPMVLAVCRRVLQHEQDAEDAFQATFLALARKAGTVRRQSAVAPWLYRVAHRTALRARGHTARSKAIVPLPAALAASSGIDELERLDLRRVLEEEVRHLPAKYRAPVVLRYLEGRSTAEAASALGCPAGTVLSRLAWARRRLQARLTARGVALPAALAAAAMARGATDAVPTRWVFTAVQAALPFVSAGASGVNQERSAILAEGVLRAMFMTKLRIGAFLAVGVLAALASFVVPPMTAGKPEAPVESMAGKPEVPAEPPPEVTICRPIKREVTESQDFVGRTEAAVSVEIRPRISGTLEKIVVRPGAEVKRGELLFELDDRLLRVEYEKADAELQRAKDKVGRANADLERVKQLFKTGAVGQEALDRPTGECAESEAGVRMARVVLERAKLDLEAAKVMAPLDGRVGRTLLDVGNLASPSTPLTSLVSVDPIYADFSMDERNFLSLRKRLLGAGTSKGLTAFLGLAGEDGFPRRGHVESADNRADPNAGTVRVRAVFSNRNGDVMPGMFARIRLVTGEPREALLVPEKAIGSAEGRHFVLVVNSDSAIEWRAVTLGPLVGELRAVQEGVEPNDRIVVGGLGSVRPGMPVRTRDAPEPVQDEASRPPEQPKH